jgi:hypothetical protein
MDQITRQNAAFVDQVDAAAGSLQELAQSLVVSVSVFELADRKALSARGRSKGRNLPASSSSRMNG